MTGIGKIQVSSDPLKFCQMKILNKYILVTNSTTRLSPLSVTFAPNQTKKRDFAPSFLHRISWTDHFERISGLHTFPSHVHCNLETESDISARWTEDDHPVLPPGLTLIISSLTLERKLVTEVQKYIRIRWACSEVFT